jgi:hypothetical protein
MEHRSLNIYIYIYLKIFLILLDANIVQMERKTKNHLNDIKYQIY